MKIALLIPILIFASCVSNNTEDKEKQLLEKELELTKKEFELTKQGKLEPESIDQSTPKQADVETLVFSTNMLSYPKKAIIKGKEYAIAIKKAFIESDDPPYDYQTTLIFSSSGIPNLILSGELLSFVVRDLNNDGQEEVIACTIGNGTWSSIEVYSLTNKMKWKSPFNSFMWWTAEEGCDAKMFWSPNKKQMRITTTNSASENFSCNEEEKVIWK